MNGILLVNKEKGITSHQVVSRLRRYFDLKQIGHTGTLDPNAEGLLQILLGKATKLNPYLKTEPKEYIATIKLGYKTNTEDIWGEIIENKEINSFDETKLNQVLNSFLGKNNQLPPMYSAVKIQGKKLYQYARNNEEVIRKPREIEIYTIKLIDWTKDTIIFKVSCSSGTYIRTLCQDIALKLNNLGTMSALTRVKIADLSLDEAFTLKDIETGNYEILKSLDLLEHYPQIEVDNDLDVKNGKPLQLNQEAKLVLITNQNEALAFYKRVEDGFYRSQRGLW